MWGNIVLLLKSYMKCDKEFSFEVSYLWKVINRKLISVLGAQEHIDTVVSISLFSIVFKMYDGNRKKNQKNKNTEVQLETWHMS